MIGLLDLLPSFKILQRNFAVAVSLSLILGVCLEPVRLLDTFGGTILNVAKLWLWDFITYFSHTALEFRIRIEC